MFLIPDDIQICFWRSARTSSPYKVRKNDYHADPCVLSCLFISQLLQVTLASDIEVHGDKVYSFVQAMVLKSTGHFFLLIWFSLSSGQLWTWAQPLISTFCREVITLSFGDLKAVQSLESLSSRNWKWLRQGYLFRILFFFSLDHLAKLLCVRLVKRYVFPSKSRNEFKCFCFAIDISQSFNKFPQ